MKKITFIALALILILSSSTQSFAQQKGHNSNAKYQKCVRSIQSTNNHQYRYNNALQYFSNEYCTTSQLQDVCHYITKDNKKFRLCVAAYPNIIDKENFFRIYNSFSSFAFAIRLYHNTQAKDVTVIYEEVHEVIEEDIIYTTSHEEFFQIITAIEDQSFSSEQKQIAKKYIAKKPLSMEQLQKIVSLFSMDDDKLEIIKFLYDYAPVPEEMYIFRNSLTFLGTKKKFDKFLINK